MALPDPPDFTVPDPTADNARAQAWSMLTAKYYDAGQWAAWGASVMSDYMTAIESLLGADAVTSNLTALKTLVDNLGAYVPPSSLTYTAPTVTADTAFPSSDIPSTTPDYTATAFSDTLLTALKNRLLADVATSSTGLGTAEAALFARHTSRVTAERTTSYNEIVNQWSSSGWDAPPGGLTAKQTELTNETSKRLTDVSNDIMVESARLAADYNKHVVSSSAQLVAALVNVFEGAENRAFEKAKIKVVNELEIFKLRVQNIISANDRSINKYSAQVNASKIEFEATQLALEDIRMKGLETNRQTTALKVEVGKAQATIAIEAAHQRLAQQLTTLTALAGGAQQVINGAMNGISASSSFGFNGSQRQVLNTTE